MLEAISRSFGKFGSTPLVKLRTKTKEDSGVSECMNDCHQGLCKVSTLYIDMCLKSGCFYQKLFGYLSRSSSKCIYVKLLVAGEHYRGRTE